MLFLFFCVFSSKVFHAAVYIQGGADALSRPPCLVSSTAATAGRDLCYVSTMLREACRGPNQQNRYLRQGPFPHQSQAAWSLFVPSDS